MWQEQGVPGKGGKEQLPSQLSGATKPRRIGEAKTRFKREEQDHFPEIPTGKGFRHLWNHFSLWPLAIKKVFHSPFLDSPPESLINPFKVPGSKKGVGKIKTFKQTGLVSGHLV